MKMYLRETGLEDMEWTNLAQDRNRWQGRVNKAKNLGVL
jgi:hypothetical protein